MAIPARAGATMALGDRKTVPETPIVARVMTTIRRGRVSLSLHGAAPPQIRPRARASSMIKSLFRRSPFILVMEDILSLLANEKEQTHSFWHLEAPVGKA